MSWEPNHLEVVPTDAESAGRGTRKGRLPADVTSFEGRRTELAAVKRLVSQHRLVTLTGFGGVGKTRLALRATRELARSFDDVAWVELADLRDPSLLVQALIDSLSIADRSEREATAVLLSHVRDRATLLVLDNCEHLLDATAELVDTMLRSAPSLRVLATSRQGLAVPGEHVLPVAPLPVPTERPSMEAGAVSLYPSMALFRERAAAVAPTFEIHPGNQAAVGELCRKLEGIPLAIELAAVKVRVLSVEDLVERLDTKLRMLSQPGRAGPTRHQTIQATIDWSHELCSPDERLLWARASVFAGGFGIEAAEAVCSDRDRLHSDDVLYALDGLVDKSVLTRVEEEGQVRFRLLEPLREYGLDRLHEGDEHDEMVHRHLAWCEELVAQSCLQWFGPSQERWCQTMRAEQANVRAAAEHCLTHAECHDRALPLLGEPWFLWVALFLDEGRHWLDRALGVCPAPTRARARALGTAGYVAALQGDRAAAEEFLREGREIAISVGDDLCLGYVTHIAGLSTLFHDPPDSIEMFQAALPLYDESDALDDQVVALRIQLGLAYMFEGLLDEAHAEFELCRELCTVTGERWLLSYALYGLGFVAKVKGNPEEALTLAREALDIKRFFGDLLGFAMTIDLLALVNADLGRARESAVLQGAAPGIWDSFGARLFGSEDWLAPLAAATQRCQELMGASAFEAAYASGQKLDLHQAIVAALAEVQAPKVEEIPELVHLTRREEEIAGLVAEGLSNRAIAERLVIAQRTAEGHVENILAKLGFHSRAQIATWIGERRRSTTSA